MPSNSLPTKDREAYSSFVQGRVLFQDYLGSGLGERLQQARDRFRFAAARDENFDIANLYLAAAETELRDPIDAIRILQRLINKGRYVVEARVQLAYAYTKQYQTSQFRIADEELNLAAEAALQERREALTISIKAYRAFLLAVRGGRSEEPPQAKREYLQGAIRIAGEILETRNASEEQTLSLFEARNALGIAHMWQGELFSKGEERDREWRLAETYYREALALRPRSVRVLENLGRLRMVQGDHLTDASDNRGSSAFYEEAKGFVKQALALNPFDQYPHYQMALLSVRTGDWTAAENAVHEGRKQKGAISETKWKKVEDAIAARNAAKLRESS